MGKLAEINKATQNGYNAEWAQMIKDGSAVFLREITGAEFLNLSPYNFKTGKFYEGQNFLNLLDFSLKRLTGAFLTFKQITELGGKINEGAKAKKVIFWSFSEAKDENGEPLLNSKGDPYSYAFLKKFNVFNLADTTLKDLPSEAPQRKEVEQIRLSIIEFAKNNAHRLGENAKQDGADFNRFLAIIGTQKAQNQEAQSGDFFALTANSLVGELLNLLICAKAGLDFKPVFSQYRNEWAELLKDGAIDFLKCAKTAKNIAEELLTWESLAQVSNEPFRIKGLLSA